LPLHDESRCPRGFDYRTGVVACGLRKNIGWRIGAGISRAGLRRRIRAFASASRSISTLASTWPSRTSLSVMLFFKANLRSFWPGHEFLGVRRAPVPMPVARGRVPTTRWTPTRAAHFEEAVHFDAAADVDFVRENLSARFSRSLLDSAWRLSRPRPGIWRSRTSWALPKRLRRGGLGQPGGKNDRPDVAANP